MWGNFPQIQRKKLTQVLVCVCVFFCVFSALFFIVLERYRLSYLWRRLNENNTVAVVNYLRLIWPERRLIRCTGADESDAGASAEHQLHNWLVAAGRSQSGRHTRVQRLLQRSLSDDGPQRRSYQGAARKTWPVQGCFVYSGDYVATLFPPVTEVMISSAVVCLFVCLLQDYAKATLPIFAKFGGKVAHGPWKKLLDFGGNRDHLH